MRLLLIRHAIAEHRRAGLPDADRALTPEGRTRFQAEVRGLQALEIQFDRALHSPWARAAQTAALLQPLLAGALEVEPTLARAPSPALLACMRSGETVAAVGHEPWLSALVSWLIAGDEAIADRVPLKKGGVVWLEGEPEAGGMALVAFLPPRVLRALGGEGTGRGG